MTNEQFWKRLEACGGNESDRIIEAYRLVAQAYREDLKVIISYQSKMTPEGLRQMQSYVNIDGGRILLCYTSYDIASHDHLETYDGVQTLWGEASLRDVLNNMFNKSVITGIAFNPHEKDKNIIIMKPVIKLLLPGEHPKPEGFHDAPYTMDSDEWFKDVAKKAVENKERGENTGTTEKKKRKGKKRRKS